MEEANYDHIEKIEKENWWYQGKRHLFDSILSAQHRQFAHALDIGCGVGSNLAILQKYAAEVDGLDFSAKAVGCCKQKGWKNVAIGDVCNLQTDKRYDLILCSEVLEHVDDHKATAEISKVLKTGGMFIFSVPANQFLWNDNDIISHHKRRYSKQRLMNLLGKDFRIRKLGFWNSTLLVPTYLVYQMQKLKKSRTITNNLNLVPGFLNQSLYRLLRVENFMFNRFSLPQGISLIGVCIKK